MPFEAASSPPDWPSTDAQSAIVIGGGFGGMAAALRLRAKGYQVTLHDRCDTLGGRAAVFEHEGFRHDAGPTVICAPHLFEDLFALFGKKLSDYVTLVAPDPWYRFVYDDGSHFDYGPTRERTEQEIARLSPNDVENYDRLLEFSRAVHDVAFTQLSDRPFHDLTFMMRQVPDLLRLKSYKTVWDVAQHHFEDERLQRAFAIQPLLLGGNPVTTTSIYSLISWLEHDKGVWFAKGGTGALVDALSTLMKEEGIDIRLSSSVAKIKVENGAATGIILDDGNQETADIIVSNCDPLHLYENMLPQSAAATMPRLRLRFGQPSMGLFVLYFGAKRQWPEVAHHTIQFSERFEGLLADIFENGKLTEDLSLYIHRPTATDPSFAPEGCDSFYVLCPVPNLQNTDIDWAIEAPKLRDAIVEKLDATILPGLRDTITADFWMTPEDFRDRYASVHGAGFSLAPLFRQSAWFRFHNRGEGLRNLYLVGAGTHPGAGVPGVVLSAKVLDNLVPEARTALEART